MQLQYSESECSVHTGYVFFGTLVLRNSVIFPLLMLCFCYSNVLSLFWHVFVEGTPHTDPVPMEGDQSNVLHKQNSFYDQPVPSNQNTTGEKYYAGTCIILILTSMHLCQWHYISLHIEMQISDIKLYFCFSQIIVWACVYISPYEQPSIMMKFPEDGQVVLCLKWKYILHWA